MQKRTIKNMQRSCHLLRSLGAATAFAAVFAALAADAMAADDAEILFWNSVKDSESAAELKAYIEAYPEGDFLALAKFRYTKLTGSPANTQPPPPPPDPEFLARQEQARLVFDSISQLPALRVLPYTSDVEKSKSKTLNEITADFELALRFEQYQAADQLADLILKREPRYQDALIYKIARQFALGRATLAEPLMERLSDTQLTNLITDVLSAWSASDSGDLEKAIAKLRAHPQTS